MEDIKCLHPQNSKVDIFGTLEQTSEKDINLVLWGNHLCKADILEAPFLVGCE